MYRATNTLDSLNNREDAELLVSLIRRFYVGKTKYPVRVWIEREKHTDKVGNVISYNVIRSNLIFPVPTCK